MRFGRPPLSHHQPPPPDPSLPPPPPCPHSLLRVATYLRRYPILALATLLCAIGSTVLVVVFPSATQRIIDLGIHSNQPHLILPLALTSLLAFFLQNALNSLRILLNNHFEQKVIFDIRSDLYAHIQKLPLHWFDNRSTGDIMTRLVEDVTSMERVLIDGIEQGIVAILQIAVVITLMLSYDPRLTLAALAPTPLLLAGALLYTLTARSRYARQRKAASDLNSLLHDNISGIRQIKTYVAEERQHLRFNLASDALRRATLTVMRAWAYYHPSMVFLASCGALLVVTYGSYLVLHSQLELGVLAAFLVLCPFLYEPIGRLHMLNQLLQSGRAAADRVFDILDSPPEPGWLQPPPPPSPPNPPPKSNQRQFADGIPHQSLATNHPPIQIADRTPPAANPSLVIPPTHRLRGKVEFRNVSFSYSSPAQPNSSSNSSNHPPPTLQNISLLALPGQSIALVGPTGAGKSTLVSLLLRFYEFSSGQILLDDTPIRNIPLTTLRQNIALVSQENFLFNASTAENLALGNPSASEEQMWEALHAANAADFVRRLPNGIHTPLGERGIRLSVGEKQRISIARALLKNPPILILDEATASVDTATERLIQQALDRLLANRTSFIIAHRLSTIQHAHQILVLRHGQIIERGSHSQLLSAGGLYSHLCQANFLQNQS